MGNCSFRSVTDSAEATSNQYSNSISQIKEEHRKQQQQEAAAVRVSAISPVKVVESGHGVWKVKLVIDPEELGRILAEEVNTEALIEQMRIAANSTPKRGKSQFLWCTSAILLD